MSARMQVRMLISTEILAQSDCGEPQPALTSRPRARELPAPTTRPSAPSSSTSGPQSPSWGTGLGESAALPGAPAPITPAETSCTPSILSLFTGACACVGRSCPKSSPLILWQDKTANLF